MEIKETIKKCLEGHQGAWEMLVNAYSKRIFNLAYQFGGSYQAAEDLTQDIFLKLYHTLSKYDYKKSFDGWILTLARNFLIDHYRKHKLEKQKRNEFQDYNLSSGPETEPESHLHRSEAQEVVWAGLKTLSPEVRMVLILRDIQGKKYDEIAEIMELPLGTVKSRVNRGRLQLAENIKKTKGEIQ